MTQEEKTKIEERIVDVLKTVYDPEIPVNIYDLGYSMEGLMPKLKLQYFGHLMPRISSLKKTLMLGKIDGKKEKGAAEQEIVR